jgi:hypothetical protein
LPGNPNPDEGWCQLFTGLVDTSLFDDLTAAEHTRAFLPMSTYVKVAANNSNAEECLCGVDVQDAGLVKCALNKECRASGESGTRCRSTPFPNNQCTYTDGEKKNAEACKCGVNGPSCDANNWCNESKANDKSARCGAPTWCANKDGTIENSTGECLCAADQENESCVLRRRSSATLAQPCWKTAVPPAKRVLRLTGL